MRSIYKTCLTLTVFISIFTCISIYNIKEEFPFNDFKTTKQSKKGTTNSLEFYPAYYDINLVITRLEGTKVDQILRTMTVEEKVGQMFMWKVQGVSISNDFKKTLNITNAGGVILMEDSVSANLEKYTTDLQAQSKIPLFIGIDQEGGLVKRIDDPNPGAQVLSTQSDTALCNAIKNTSEILYKKGINLNFGIVADIAWFSDSFITPRSFGKAPESVSYRVGQSVICTENIFSTLKHFPGHGRTTADSHKTIPKINISSDEWRRTDLLPFKNGIKNGADFVMIGHLIYSSIDSSPASLSKIHIDNLRNLGFEGVVITDDIGMLEDSGIPPFEALDKAIDAGNDIILYVHSSKKFEELYKHTLDRVYKGEISEERIDESVRRILEKKVELMGE